MFYCQHVLGMGHLIRSLEIVRALSKDCEVYFINGGEPVHELPLDSSIQVINLDPIKSDAEFQDLKVTDHSRNLGDIQTARRTRLLAEWERVQPHVFVTELFPFGRIRFAFELIPLLARNRLQGNPTKVVCSLRDILVGKSDQTGHEAWVCSLMNRFYDMLLIHADPQFQTLDETFSRVKDLQCPIHYTGFVAQASQDLPDVHPEDPVIASSSDPLILVSIGGGRVGYELVEASIQASPILAQAIPHRMLIFTGPYMPEEQLARLKEQAQQTPHIILRRFTPHFLSFLQQADLSISMAGYNTCMNIVTTGTKALMLPFTGRGNEEQTIRAQKLQDRGLIDLLDPEELSGAQLAQRMAGSLQSSGTHETLQLDVTGAQTTARFIQTIASRSNTPAAFPAIQTHKADSWQRTLQQGLEDLQTTGNTIKVFLRDDDIDTDEETLRSLADITISNHVPLNLEIIPGSLTGRTIRFLKNLKRIDPPLIEFNQHGWQHLNHEKEGRKCEFGVSRNIDQQREDISRGKAILEDAFPLKFFPVFTPPWNRCTPDTFKVLDELGFLVLSKDQGKQPIAGYGFQEISTSLDLYRWKGGASMKGPEEIVTDLIGQMTSQSVIGLLLHHKVMDATAFDFLDDLLKTLRSSPLIQFHSFHSLVGTPQ